MINLLSLALLGATVLVVGQLSEALRRGVGLRL